MNSRRIFKEGVNNDQISLIERDPLTALEAHQPLKSSVVGFGYKSELIL